MGAAPTGQGSCGVDSCESGQSLTDFRIPPGFPIGRVIPAADNRSAMFSPLGERATCCPNVTGAMRWCLSTLFVVCLLTGCAGLSPFGAKSADDSCDTCTDGSCGWCGGHFCVGRHARYHSILDAWVTRHEARHLARAELRDIDDNSCLDCDYKLGFEQAFVDVSVGASGQVPALPPANYWRSWNRTAEGHARAQNWFAGYAAGATRAVPIYEPFNTVASSGLPGYELSGHNFTPAAGVVPAAEWQHSMSP